MDNFHVTLLELAKYITSDVLDNLKYLCQDVVLPSRMEKVKTARDLFQALEECGKISVNNTQYLIDLLEAEGKSSLARKLAPFNRGSATNMLQESLSSYIDVQQQQRRTEFPNVPEARLNVYRQVLRQISNSLSREELHNLCYISEEAMTAGMLHRANLNGVALFNFLESRLLISPDNLEYLREKLYRIHRLDLHHLVEQYIRSYLGGYPKPLSGQQAPAVAEQRYDRQLPHYPDQTMAILSHHPHLSHPTHSMNTVQDDNSLPTPTQVEDDNEDVNLATSNTGAQFKTHQLERREQESQQGVMEVTMYQNNQHQLEEEVRYRRELEQKEIELQRHQAALQEREETINQITQQYERQLHLLRHVKAESGSEKERLQQQIREYEQMLQQNNEQIEILRRENQQGPAVIGPVGEKYHMDKTPHGIAVIINNSVFHSVVPTEDPLQDRRGSQVDEDNLRVTWEYLRYDVRIFKNLTASEMTRQLMQIALQNHEKYDSFVCCILSHGYLDGVYGTDSKPVKINDIASLFKGNFCPTLADKPKLFFIQACRGDDEDRGVVVQKDAKGDSDDAFRHSLPSEADFLFGYATPPGNVSWRSPRYGSWYISKLCEVFVDYSPQQDLLSMLTIVNHKVSEAYTTQGYKQCPAPVTLLRKQVWFFANPL